VQSASKARSAVRLPPRWLRLLLVTPVVFVAAALVTLASPVLHLVLALIDVADRRGWRFSRLGGIGIALCVTEFVGLSAVFVLWVGSGFGAGLRSTPFQRAHNRVFGWWLELVTRALRFYLGFEFVLPTTERVTGPILTFARHAGPGDAFLLARTVIQDYGRQLRMVGTNKLLWDPFINHMMLRLPNHFCDQNPRHATEELAAITELCATMTDDSVLIIFPEGGNWTPQRWHGAIERLQTRGQHDRAVRAQAMTHVLAPRSAGALAALAARDDLSVVFVAHVGLEDLYSLRRIWDNIPLRRNVQAAYWTVPGGSIPDGRDEVVEWLFDRWAEVDTWIAEHAEEAFSPTVNDGRRPPSPQT